MLTVNEIITSPAIAYEMGIVISTQLHSTYIILPTILAVGVALSAAGSCHGSVMAGGKSFYAVARNGQLPIILTELTTNGAPYMALLAQGLWAILLLMLPSSSFASLLGYFGPASWFFYALTSTTVVYFRLKQPYRNRPYMLYLYPLPIVLVIMIAMIIIVSSFMTELLYTSLAFGFILMSLPVYLVLRKFKFLSAGVVVGSGIRYDSNASLTGISRFDIEGIDDDDNTKDGGNTSTIEMMNQNTSKVTAASNSSSNQLYREVPCENSTNNGDIYNPVYES